MRGTCWWMLCATLVAACVAEPRPRTAENEHVDDLPVVELSVAAEIPDEPKVPCTVRIDLPDGRSEAPPLVLGACGIELRGKTAMLHPKRSYNLELRTASGEERSASVLGMPANADWALNAVYIDPSLFRHRLSFDLFMLLGERAPHTRFVELYLNDQYEGVYLLSEKMNREALALSAWDDERSVIYKATWHAANFDQWYGGAQKATWHDGYELEYPRPHMSFDDGVWDPLDQLVEQAAIGDEDDFSAHIGELVDLDALIDWHLLLLFTHNNDGATKNYFLVQDRLDGGSEPFFVVPWDYDATFGQDWDSVLLDSHGWVSNHLLDRLLAEDDFRAAWCVRFSEVLTQTWSARVIDGLIDRYVSELAGGAGRNFARWPLDGPFYQRSTTFVDEVAYIRAWNTAHRAWLEQELDTRCP